MRPKEAIAITDLRRERYERAQRGGGGAPCAEATPRTMTVGGKLYRSVVLNTAERCYQCAFIKDGRCGLAEAKGTKFIGDCCSLSNRGNLVYWELVE